MTRAVPLAVLREARREQVRASIRNKFARDVEQQRERVKWERIERQMMRAARAKELPL